MFSVFSIPLLPPSVSAAYIEVKGANKLPEKIKHDAIKAEREEYAMTNMNELKLNELAYIDGGFFIG